MIFAELTVAAVVLRDRHYLMVEEIADGHPVINQPAGHVEPGETLVEAIVRETREETLWRFTPTGFVGLYHRRHATDAARSTLRVAFCGTVDDHDANRALDRDILAARWFTHEELAHRNDLRSELVLQTTADFEYFGPLALDRVRHLDGVFTGGINE